MPRALLATSFSFVVAFAACGGTPATAPTALAPEAPVEKAAADDPPPGGPPVGLDCGDYSTCAIVEGGAVRCWGRDKNGELGDGGEGGDRARSVIVRGVENASAIALGSRFACALGTDKKVKCWGTGRIANDGAAKERAKPIVVGGVDDAVELVASGAIACARGPSTVTCWGADGATIGSPPAGAFTQVAAGFTHGCALDKKGAVVCWGTGDWNAPKGSFSKPPVTGASYVATGDRHACVVTKDKRVQCWGMNDLGQLGTKPDTEQHKSPVTVPGVTGVDRLVAGEAAMCAIHTDGSAHCWGANEEGELGLGRKSSDERPARVAALSDVSSLCLATAHGCALTKSRHLLCWGANVAGQLGIGSPGKDRKLEPSAVSW